MMPIEMTNYQDLVKKLEEASGWLRAFGAKIEESRVGRMRQNLIEFGEYFETGQKITAPTNQFEEFFVSLSDTMDIVKIYTNLKDNLTPELKIELGKLASGPFLPRNENPQNGSTASRDAIFELVIASELIRRGFELTSSGLADIRIKHNAQDIFVECKRPQSINSLQRQFKKANKQLRTRIKSRSGRAYGLVAISTSKVLNSGDKLIGADNHADLSKKLDVLMNKVFDETGKYFVTKPDGKVMGVMIHFTIPAVLRDRELPLICQQVGLYCLTPPFKSGRRVLASLAKSYSPEGFKQRIV